MTMSEEARRQVEEFERDRATGAAMNRVPSWFGVHTIGTVALADVGNTVWTDPDRRRSRHDEPLGGIILGIVAQDEVLDGETGEIRVKRSFRCFDYMAAWDEAFQTFADELIPQGGVEFTETPKLVRAIRRFCRQVAAGTTNVLTSDDKQLITDAFHLAATLIGDHLHG